MRFDVTTGPMDDRTRPERLLWDGIR